MKRTLALSLFLVINLVLAPALNLCAAQTTPFLSDEEIWMLSNEISGDRAFEHIRWLTHWHRDSGMEGFFKARDYVMQAAREAGVDEVRFVEQPLEGPNYTARAAELWMVEPVELKLADIAEHAGSDAEVAALRLDAREMILPGGMASHFQVLVQNKD